MTRAHGAHIPQLEPREGVTHINTTAHRLATAHIPISPIDTCGDCKHFLPCNGRRHRGRCKLWATMRGERWRFEFDTQGVHEFSDWWCAWPTIPRKTAACKYLDLIDAQGDLL